MNLDYFNMKTHLTIQEKCKVTKKINLRNQLVLQKSLTWPDVLSSVCQIGPLGTSDSTVTVKEPRTVLFHTMSQSYIVTFIYGSV
jgi:hypothetical protein